MYSPSANNIGMDLNVPTVRMVNRDAATLVVGDVVVMSTAHTGVVYPPTTRTQEPFSPLASIVKAGSAPFTAATTGWGRARRCFSWMKSPWITSGLAN